jgi:uncharacterized membrane protein YeiH
LIEAPFSTAHIEPVFAMRIIEALGIIAFALSGFIEAYRRRMDIVGVFTVAFITAFGGGTLRDILLERRPLFWVEHQEYTLLVFILSLIAIPLLRRLDEKIPTRAIMVADAIGLGLFSVTGAALASAMSMPPFVVVMMGVITGIFGGVLRDIVCNEIPLVFRSGELYATCAFAGCWCYLLLQYLGMPEIYNVIASSGLTVSLRLAAMRYDWRLPG